MDDGALLRQFVQTGSHGAFGALTERYANLVYACALQRVHDAQAAHDVAQAVFLTLARKAKDLRADVSLPGWLFTTTRYIAIRYQRGEQRRKEREMRAFERQQIDQPDPRTAALWAELEPHLAQALDGLSAADRETLLLRFYQKASHRQIADRLRISEDAAEKRVGRALDKLRRVFARKGVTLSAAALASVLGAHAVSAAPPGLAAALATSALAATAGSLAASETLMLAKGAIHMIVWNKIKIAALFAAALVLLAGGGVVATRYLADRDASSATNTLDPISVVEPVKVVAQRPTLPPPASPLQNATTTQPGSTEATAPAPRPSYADPKSACATFFLALRARDFEAIADAVASPDPDRTRIFCEVLPVMFAMGDLAQACQARFGDWNEGWRTREFLPDRLDQWLAKIPAALARVEGDTATLEWPAGEFEDGRRTHDRFVTGEEFRRIDGEWKFWIADAPSDKETKLASQADKFIPMIQELTREVRDGKYDNPQAVRSALEQRANWSADR